MIYKNTFKSLIFNKNTVSLLCKHFPVIASKSEEEFDFSPSNVVAGVHINNTLDILEIISNCRSDPLTLLDLDLPANSYRIACTNI